MLLLDQYDVKIVKTEGVTPKCHISDESHTILYIYNGDVSQLVLMAQRVGRELSSRRRVPLLATTELS